MDTQKSAIILNLEKSHIKSKERKLYPLTGEILEKGEDLELDLLEQKLVEKGILKPGELDKMMEED